MRHLLIAASTVGLMLASGAALAQSGQGGYTGKDPNATPPSSSTRQPAARGSGQGGYLGTNPGDANTNSSSGSAGNTMGSGQGGYLGSNPAGTPGGTTTDTPPAGGGRTRTR